MALGGNQERREVSKRSVTRFLSPSRRGAQTGTRQPVRAVTLSCPGNKADTDVSRKRRSLVLEPAVEVLLGFSEPAVGRCSCLHLDLSTTKPTNQIGTTPIRALVLGETKQNSGDGLRHARWTRWQLVGGVQTREGRVNVFDAIASVLLGHVTPQEKRSSWNEHTVPAVEPLSPFF